MGVVIGTGVYIDDLQAQNWVSTQRALIAAGQVLLLTLAISIIVACRITGPSGNNDNDECTYARQARRQAGGPRSP